MRAGFAVAGIVNVGTSCEIVTVSWVWVWGKGFIGLCCDRGRDFAGTGFELLLLFCFCCLSTAWHSSRGYAIGFATAGRSSEWIICASMRISS
jgi:hypothetical protein